jgi:hypothetical protein
MLVDDQFSAALDFITVARQRFLTDLLLADSTPSRRAPMQRNQRTVGCRATEEASAASTIG